MESEIRYYRVSGKDLVYMKFILEAYEGLSTMSTVDSKQGIVKVEYPVAFASDVAELMNAIANEITVTEVVPGGELCWSN